MSRHANSRYLKAMLWLLVTLVTSPFASADDAITVNQVLQESNTHRGFINVWYNQNKDKTYFVIDKNLGDFIYQTSLPQGLGSNDIGLDRGQLGETRLSYFKRAGGSIMLVQKNTEYQALSDNKREVDAMAESFANAILWRLPLVDQDESYWLVDASDFLVQDTHDIADRLKSRKQGSFRLDKSKSAVSGDSYKSFPDNTELQVWLTFTGSEPGKFVRQAAIDPKNVSLTVRHSFVRLPDDNYEPLAFHPKSGYFSYSYQDYAQPINAKLTQQLIPRHRLAKVDPSAPRSKAKKPIVYYIDSGVPEPVRSALIEGAMWWNQAFEAIGYEDAFQVKVLPADADPMDVRYNIIQWVHRATRGWSYGASIVDPRTGEIIKGHVSLGSLRVRQDYLIAQAMLAPFAGDATQDKTLQTLAINRIKQLSAHEVGHTLGIAHNFAASAYNRASVMDYPHPFFELNDGKISAPNAYTEELGIWDKRAVAYAYSDFTGQDAGAERQKLLQENVEKGYWFISDADSRGIDDAHPTSNLWDNGSNATDELARLIKIREVALKQFGDANLRTGRPYSDLEEILVPAYYFHRFQAIAAGKAIGGYEYYYDIKGQDALTNKHVGGAEQERALETLVATLSPGFLSIEDGVAAMIPPKAHNTYRTRESINGDMGVIFDRFTLASASAQHTFNILLNDQRLMRLKQQNSIDSTVPSVDILLEATYSALANGQAQNAIEDEIRRQALALLHNNMLNKLHATSTPNALKEHYFTALNNAHDTLKAQLNSGDYGVSAVRFLRYEIFRLEELIEGEDFEMFSLPKMPPGSPI